MTSSTDIISRLRPRTVGELIDGAFRLYRRNFRTFLLIVAVVYLPVQLLSYAADLFLLGRYAAPDISAPRNGSAIASGLVSQVDTLKTYFEAFLSYFAQWALTVAIVGAISGQAVSVGEAYGEVRRSFWSVVGLVGLQTLILLGLFSPLILVLIASLSGGTNGAGSFLTVMVGCVGIFSLIYAIIQIRLQVILPAAVNEELTPRQALTRSWELTRNYWWRTLAFGIVLNILRSIVSLGPAALIVLLVNMPLRLDFYSAQGLTQGIGIFATAIFMPVEMGAVALYYYDQRIRKEGFDLDTAIADRYENGEAGQYQVSDASEWGGQEARPQYAEYGQMQPSIGVGTTPLPVPPVEPDEVVAARSVQQDRNLYPLLASGQYGRAMQTFNKKRTREERRQNGTDDAEAGTSRVRRVPRPDPGLAGGDTGT